MTGASSEPAAGPAGGMVLLQRRPRLRLWSGLIGAPLVGAGAAALFWSAGYTQIGLGVLLWGSVLLMVLWHRLAGPFPVTFGVDLHVGEVQVGRRRSTGDAGAELHRSSAPDAGRPGHVRVTHRIVVDGAAPFDLHVASSGRHGMTRDQLVTYERFLTLLDLGPRHRGAAEAAPSGGRPDLHRELLRADALREVRALLARPEAGQSPPPDGFESSQRSGLREFVQPHYRQLLDQGETLSAEDLPRPDEVSGDESTEAREADLAYQERHADRLREARAVVEEIDGEILSSARLGRAARRVFGCLALACAGVFALYMAVDVFGEPTSEFRVFAGVVLYLIGGPAFFLWCVSFDLSVHQIRRLGRRLLAPGSPGGQAAGQALRIWDPRGRLNPAAQADAEQIVRESGAAPASLGWAYSKNPYRSLVLLSVLALFGGLVGVLAFGVDGHDIVMATLFGALGVAGLVGFCWFASLNDGMRWANRHPGPRNQRQLKRFAAELNALRENQHAAYDVSP